MPALPPASDFTGSTRTEGQVKAAINDQRAFLADLVGSDGTAQTALATLGALAAVTAAISVNTTLTSADRGKVLRVTATATLTLPSLAAVPTGWALVVRTTGAGTATLAAAGSDLVNGAASAVVRPSSFVVLQSVGTEWQAFGPGGALALIAGSAAAPSLAFVDDANTGLFSPVADQLALAVNGTERLRMSTTGLRLGIAGTSPASALDVRGETVSDASINVFRHTADAGGSTVRLRKTRGTAAAPTVPLLNDTLGSLFFGGLETGSTFTDAAAVIGIAMADFAAGATAARLSLRTAAPGTNVLVERLRLSDAAAEVTGRLHVNAAEANAFRVTIADDAVATFTTGRSGGFAMLTAGGQVGGATTAEAHSATMFFDVGTTPFLAKSTGISGVGGQVDCVTGTVLTGTTGTDGNITVSARNNGTLTIENRRGISTVVTLWVF